MVSNYLKPLNIFCILSYVAFMGLALNSKVVDALVLYVSEKNGRPVYISGAISTSPVVNTAPASAPKQTPIVAIQYKSSSLSEPTDAADATTDMAAVSDPATLDASATSVMPEAPVMSYATVEMQTKEAASAKPDNTILEMAYNSAAAEATALNEPAAVETPAPRVFLAGNEKPVADTMRSSGSALTYIDAIGKNKWEFATLLDRYIVRYDKDTYIVLTIRPAVQKMLEEVFGKYSTRIGAGIVQDPATGEVLAITTSHRSQVTTIESEEFKTDNWALKPTFPIASIYKIITSAAGIDTGNITANSGFIAWGKTYMKVWKAFACSHNGVFGRIARKTGHDILERYSTAFGFNKPFFFDLPVGKSLADLPNDQIKFGQAAAGLNRDFLVSPMHVASIISTILNRGKTMKPYLVDYVVRKNKVIFRRKPFQLAQPIKATTAKEIYKMMYGTTSVGTGKKGFGGFRSCPDLATICGGKTGTLTGASPNYLFTWFGGFTKATGRDLCIVTLVGQNGHSGTKASAVAGQIAYELYMKRQGKSTTTVARASRKSRR